jgi:hypothetical protein
MDRVYISTNNLHVDLHHYKSYATKKGVNIGNVLMIALKLGDSGRYGQFLSVLTFIEMLDLHQLSRNNLNNRKSYFKY